MNGVISISYIRSELNLGNPLTKGLIKDRGGHGPLFGMARSNPPDQGKNL